MPVKRDVNSMYVSFYLGVRTLCSCFPWLLSPVLRLCPCSSLLLPSCSTSRSPIIVSFLIVDLGVEHAQNWDGGGFASLILWGFFAISISSIAFNWGNEGQCCFFSAHITLGCSQFWAEGTEAVALTPPPPSFQILHLLQHLPWGLGCFPRSFRASTT